MTPANDNTPRPQAFDDLLAQYEPFIRKQCNRLVPNSPEDAYQETVCRALAQWASFRPDGHFPTWINFLVRKVQASGQRRAFALPYLPATVAPATQEDALVLRDALDKLPKRAAKLVVARATGCSFAELGKKRGVCKDTIANRVAEAMARMAANDNEKASNAAA